MSPWYGRSVSVWWLPRSCRSRSARIARHRERGATIGGELKWVVEVRLLVPRCRASRGTCDPVVIPESYESGSRRVPRSCHDRL